MRFPTSSRNNQREIGLTRGLVGVIGYFSFPAWSFLRCIFQKRSSAFWSLPPPPAVKLSSGLKCWLASFRVCLVVVRCAGRRSVALFRVFDSCLSFLRISRVPCEEESNNVAVAFPPSNTLEVPLKPCRGASMYLSVHARRLYYLRSGRVFLEYSDVEKSL